MTRAQPVESVLAVNVRMPIDAEPSQEEGAQMAVLLDEVFADLTRLRAQVEGTGATPANGTRGGIQALQPTLAEGCAAISRRLEALGHPTDSSRPPFPDPVPPAKGNAVALTAYRPCFSHLGRALREARRISDEQTMAILSCLVVRLEKHLWLSDLPLTERRVLDWSAVNLFSLC
jgi:hypothetical protein